MGDRNGVQGQPNSAAAQRPDLVLPQGSQSELGPVTPHPSPSQDVPGEALAWPRSAGTADGGAGPFAQRPSPHSTKQPHGVGLVSWSGSP